MNFCCGIANEEPLLYEIYGKDIELISFDRSEEMISLTKELDLKRKSIMQLDVSDLYSYFKRKKFGLIIGRNIPINPNHNADLSGIYPDIWPKFLKNLRRNLANGGSLLMTFAREDEFERGIELMKAAHFNVLVKENNKIVIPSDRIGIAGADIKDNYVVIAN